VTTVTYTFPEYRLAKLLKQPGGKSVADAVKDAETGVASLADRCRDARETALKALDAAWAQADRAAPRLCDLDALYDRANALIGLGAPSGLPLMDEVAYSLCDVADAMRRHEAPSAEPISVHVHALHLIHHMEGQPAAFAAMAEGLRQVRDRVLGALSPPEPQPAAAAGNSAD